jgi:hypothetical protein
MRLGFRNGTTPKILHEKCRQCMATKSTQGFCNLSTCGNYCAIERTGGDKAKWNICMESDACLKYMTPEPYLQGKSRILVEDSIAFVEPEGEICYGGTIDTCTTVTVIFDDNSKIGLHINPSPLQMRELFQNFNSTPEPVITYENLWTKIREVRRQNEKVTNAVKAVYVITSPQLITRGSPLNLVGHVRSEGNAQINSSAKLLNTNTLRAIVQDNIEGFTKNTVFEYDPNISLHATENPDHHLVIRAGGIIDRNYDHSL